MTEEIITRKEFHDLCEQRKFADGPYLDSVGDGYGDPYIPPKNRDVFGTLKDGRKVRAHGEHQQ